MNVIKINNKAYKYESFWRPSENKKTYDYKNNLLPFPKSGEKWQNQLPFINKLKDIQQHIIRKNKFIKYDKDEYKNCMICNKKNITKGFFQIKNIRWEEGLVHYISEHNIKPTEKFIDLIFAYTFNDTSSKVNIGKFNARIEIKNEKKYLKLDRNQILILDALMDYGSYKRYIDNTNKSVYRFSEHAGLLDFNDTGLERIIVKGNTKRVDRNDNTIFMPGDFTPDELDFEYFFHTHPPTDGPGGRAVDGVLYEFPSIGDIIAFVNSYNENKVQGSMVITPEGMYIIRNYADNMKPIKFNYDKFFDKVIDIQTDLENRAIRKYGTTFTKEIFYSKISQDKKYIDEYNKFLNTFSIHIDYYPRIKDDLGSWIIDTVYLPIYVVEPDFNIA
jgi:hypothetical protein